MDITRVTNADLLIHALELKPRAHYCLRRNGVRTIGDLLRMTPIELTSLRGVGGVVLMEVRLALAECGLHLKDDPHAEYFLSGEAGKRPEHTWNYRYKE